MQASSAMRAILRQSGQVASQRSGTSVAVRADEQFAPNRPIFRAFLLYIWTRWNIDPGSMGVATAASCIASSTRCRLILSDLAPRLGLLSMIDAGWLGITDPVTGTPAEAIRTR